jgi:hypothetical protein
MNAPKRSLTRQTCDSLAQSPETLGEVTMKKPSTAFWVLAVLFLLWNLFGCSIYLVERMASDAAYTDFFGPKMASVRDLPPIWSNAAYAIAVWGGLLAAIMMLLRRGFAVPLFILSFLAAIISFAWGFTSSEYIEAAGGIGAMAIMPVIVVLLGACEIFYSRRARSKGYLR